MSAPEKPEMTAGEIRALADSYAAEAEKIGAKADSWGTSRNGELQIASAVLSEKAEEAQIVARALREMADRMERPEPSADEASAIDAAHYAIMEAVGGTVCNPRTCRVMPILRRLALAIAAIREAPAQADAPTSVPVPATTPATHCEGDEGSVGFVTSAPQRGEQTAAKDLGPIHAILQEWYKRGSITDDERGEVWSGFAALRAEVATLKAERDHPVRDNRPMPDEAYNELYRTFRAVEAERDAALAKVAAVRAVKRHRHGPWAGDGYYVAADDLDAVLKGEAHE